MTVLTSTNARRELRTDLWIGAGLTAFGALFFPRINAVIHDHERIWHLDHEAAVLAPVVVVAALAAFALVGPWAWSGRGNRPARAGLAAGIASIVGGIVVWICVPIIAGGLAVTLGLEGLRRADEGRRRTAIVAVALGVVGVLGGAAFWLVGA